MKRIAFHLMAACAAALLTACARGQPPATVYEFKQSATTGDAWNYPKTPALADSLLALDANAAPRFTPRADFATAAQLAAGGGVPLLGNGVGIYNSAAAELQLQAVQGNGATNLVLNGTRARLAAANGGGGSSNLTLTADGWVTFATIHPVTGTTPMRLLGVADAIGPNGAVNKSQLDAAAGGGGGDPAGDRNLQRHR